MMQEQIDSESKRGRVRRLLINPLIADGFRAPARANKDKHHADLDRVADDLSYMSDDALRVLRRSLVSKGEGSSKCFWPCYATIIGLAEMFEPRPLEELPGLLRWFASNAGREAINAGRHVVEYEFWKKYKRPPVLPDDRTRIDEKLERWRDRRMRAEDQINRHGKTNFPDDQLWLDWYLKQDAYVRSLIEHEAA